MEGIREFAIEPDEERAAIIDAAAYSCLGSSTRCGDARRRARPEGTDHSPSGSHRR
jgi:hypothetical protein